MKRKKNTIAQDTITVILFLSFIVLTVMLALTNVKYLIISAAILIVVIILVLILARNIRKSIRVFFYGGEKTTDAQRSGIAAMPLPVAATSNKKIIWYNSAFYKDILDGMDSGTIPLSRIIPEIDYRLASMPSGQDIEFEGKSYTAYGTVLPADKSIYYVTFVENSLLKKQSQEYLATRPSVLFFVLDTYDEILKEMKESERALIMSNIDTILEKFVSGYNGFIRRITASKFVAVIEERYIKQIVEQRFDILDEIRALDGEGMTITLSIGVGRGGETLALCEEMANQALDMALGRGGDQAAVKSSDGFEFYGGVSRSVEKRTKVKSRIIATAIKDLLPQYEKVLIMGHKNSDMDSVGAATGMLRFCRFFNKQASIVVDYDSSVAKNLLDLLIDSGYEDIFLTPDEAITVADSKTLLIVVDTHVKFLLESNDVYDSCGGVVLIDHHRRMVNHIDDAIIFYHEPYASSASELVSEMLVYAGDGKSSKLTAVEAEALLAGIMLDTRTFSLHVGVRTFEASAFLRRAGAQTEEVKRLFASSMNEYLYRSHLVSEAVFENSCAIVVSDKIPADNEVVAPQAANDLLTICGVKASFVAVKQGDEIRISARSMGEVNVQLVMEKLKGGGHLTMAGAQLKGVSIDEAEKMIRKAVSEYFKERAAETK